MNACNQQTIMQTLIQVRQNRLNYYSQIAYSIVAVIGTIGLFVAVHYWKKYSDRIQKVKQHNFKQLQIFRNAMRKDGI
jgi:hypothetical protein